jgi:hypothetical protein
LQRLRFRRDSGSFDDGIERLRVVNGDFAQHFPIQGNVSLFTAVNELAISNAPLPACCAQSGNPHAPEIAFSTFAVGSSVDICPDAGFFGQSKQPACGTTMAFCCF